MARDLKNVHVYWFHDRVFLCHPCRCPHRKTTFISCAWRAISSLPYLTYLPPDRVRRNGDTCVWCGSAADTVCGGAPSGLRGTVVPRNCPYIALYTKNGRKCGYLVHRANNVVVAMTCPPAGDGGRWRRSGRFSVAAQLSVYLFNDHTRPFDPHPHVLVVFEGEPLIGCDQRRNRDIPRIPSSYREHPAYTLTYHN